MTTIHRINPLIEALKSGPERIQKILIIQGTSNPRHREIARLARGKKIPVQYVPGAKLDRVARENQGAAALLSAKPLSTLAELLDGEKPPCVLLLDGVEDPQNLGAILRTAEGAGVNGVILPERRSAGLTGTVSTVSAGALEHIKVVRVNNLVRTMKELKKAGFWLVGAEGGARDPWTDFDYTLPVGLVFGSEGRGLRPLVRKTCDRILSLPLFGRISSLNVAASAAVFIYEVVRQRKIKNSVE